MTNNNPITTENLDRGDRIRKEGQSIDEVRTISRIRMIDHERFRIDTVDGDAAVAHKDDVWELITDNADDINDSQI